MSIKVLHILSGDLWGGAEAQMGLQIRAQRELGLDSRVILFNDGETKKRYLEFGIPLEVFSENKGLVQLFSKARNSALKFGAQIIVSHGYKETFVGSGISFSSKAPLVSTIHGGTESYRGVKAFKSFFYSTLYLFLSRNLAKATIVPTDGLKQQLGLQAEVIANVADLSPKGANLSELRNSIGFQSASPFVVWVGRLAPVKRVDRAIQAIHILKNWGLEVNLAIVGIGELAERSKKLVCSLGLQEQIKFLGFRNDAASLIDEADILLLTSESEGLPTVMAEAMTSGTRLVMSSLPGIREVAQKFSDYSVKLVLPHTPEAFAASIKEVLENKTSIPPEILEQTRAWFDPKRAAREFIEVANLLRRK